QGEVGPARVGHGAVVDAPACFQGMSTGAQVGQGLFDPGGDPTVARHLCLSVPNQELLRVGGTVRVVGVVQVEFGVALVRVVLVDDGGVHPLGECAVSRDVRGQQHDTVRGLELQRGHVEGVPGRGVGDGGFLGLLLVVQRQGTAPAPSGEDDVGVTPAFSGVTYARPQVLDHLFHDQRDVAGRIAAVAVGDVVPGAWHRVAHRQVRTAPDGVHEDDDGVGGHVLGTHEEALQHHALGDPAVGVAVVR